MDVVLMEETDERRLSLVEEVGEAATVVVNVGYG